MALTPAASAHRLDEYLQATLVVIEPGSISLQMNLTPGVDIAKKWLTEVDRNGDGAISEKEAAAYFESVRRDVTVRLDGHALTLKAGASSIPEREDLLCGWGILQIEFTATPGIMTPGPHKLFIKNRHWPRESVYLLNAGMPKFFESADSKVQSTALEITGQKRNENQSVGEIVFTIHSRARHSNPSPMWPILGGLFTAGTLGWTAILRGRRKNQADATISHSENEEMRRNESHSLSGTKSFGAIYLVAG